VTELLHAPPPPLLQDPEGDEYTQPFWDNTLKLQLTAPRCTQCGTFRLPPTRFCHCCQTQTLEYVHLPATGTLYTYTVVRHPLRPDMADRVPYIPAVVDPDGATGCRFVSNVVNCEPEDLAVGMPLKVAWHHISRTYVFPFWEPA
jgi:uncharacterized OB-fold protein